MSVIDNKIAELSAQRSKGKRKKIPEPRAPGAGGPRAPDEESGSKGGPPEPDAKGGEPEGPSEARKDEGRAKKPEGVLWELLMLLIKIAVIAAAFIAIFTFVFGIYRNHDLSMSPAVKDGDLVIYYRYDKNYTASDTLVLEYEGEKQTRRVVAIAGDTVDFDSGVLIVNGAPQLEMNIYEPTYRYETAIEFPLTVGENEVFVLGDGRENATDSRVYGAVNASDTLGKVMAVIRTRGV